MHNPIADKIIMHRSRRKRRRDRGLSFNCLVPNIITAFGLCAGLSAIRFSIRGHFTYAVTALLIAACMDGLDGRIARLLKGTSRFGAEFDSLSDLVCFGVVPPFILTLWALPVTERLSFIPFILFTICMALRLARFNSALDDDIMPEYGANFFFGVPAPVGAGLALFPVFLGLEAKRNHLGGVEHFSHSPWLSGSCLILTAFLLVSTFPIWSFKNFKVPARYILPMLVGGCGYVVIFTAEPWGALAAAGLFYLVIIPLSGRSYWRLRREAEASRKPVEYMDIVSVNSSDRA